MDKNLEKACFAAGCFWCVEAIFQQLKGVLHVRSGYTGGSIKNPAYREVCSGSTGHAEALEIEFDPSVISYTELLDIFWTTHDPTTLNRQGADKGTQYRSAIFYYNDKQRDEALKSKADVASQLWQNPIVTEISPMEIFYVAEDYHQNYYNNHGNESYCQIVIEPKIKKFQQKYLSKLK